MEAANIPDSYRYLVFPLFSKWCCQTDMLTVVTIDGVSKTRQEHLTGKLPGWIDHLKVAGMAGVIKTHTPTTSKVSARGKTCLFACYSTDHARDCFVMMDPQTKSIIHSRDVLWLNRMYFPDKKTPGATVLVKGLSKPTKEGSVVSESDSNESSSSAGKKKRLTNMIQMSRLGRTILTTHKRMGLN